MAQDRTLREDRHDRRCAERIRTRRLLEAGEPADPPLWLLREIAGEIRGCCGHGWLKAHRLAGGWTVDEAVAAFHGMCKERRLGSRGLTGRSWLEWEAGARPNGDYQDLLCRLFETGPVQLGFATDYREPAEDAGQPAAGPLRLGAVAGSLDGSGGVVGVGESTNRRDVCKGVGAAAVSPAALKGVLGEAAAEAMEFTRRAEASAVGSGVLEHLELVVTDFSLALACVPQVELFDGVRWYRNAVGRLIGGPHTLREGRQLYAYAGWLSRLLAWLAFELGDLRAAEAYGVDAWRHGWQAGHDELCAWAMEAKASIAWYANQPGRALAAALRGSQVAPAGHPVGVRLAAHAARAYGRLHQREDFEAALRQAVGLHERLPARPPTLFGRDTAQFASYALICFAATSCNALALPEQARRHAVDALDLLTTAPEEYRSPTREAIARIDLALALVPLGSPDEACGLGRQALSSQPVAFAVRARALDLDAVLQCACPDLPEAGEFHERCRLLTRPSPPDPGI
ncbi:MAG: XRE family transcriptional regulator [Egibacteraceae bacterium]